jgi:taurine dioxygenase
LRAEPGQTAFPKQYQLAERTELPERESDAMLDYLFKHQLQPQFRYTNVWAENDLLIWDHLGTLHRAIADYGPDEIRLIRRCQVMATKVFDPEFLRCAHELAAAEAA